jgi:hypothetical protein
MNFDNLKSISLADIHEEFVTFIDSVAKHNVFTRSTKLQEQLIQNCSEIINQLKSFKYQAIQHEQEHEANQLFHMQCVINALKSSLSIWVNLKKSEFLNAWISLVDAQDYVNIAFKVADYEGLRKFEQKLQFIEESIFPDWAYFNSTGHIETIGKCSICGLSFLKCDHIEDMVYMGRLCRRIGFEITEFNHTSLVDIPKDKRCVMTKISEDSGQMIDYFTWEPCNEKKNDSEGMHFESLVYSTHVLDLD